LTDFHNFFTDVFSRKLAIKLLIEILPHLKCVAALPCEMLKTEKTSNNLNKVSCLTINQQTFNERH